MFSTSASLESFPLFNYFEEVAVRDGIITALAKARVYEILYGGKKFKNSKNDNNNILEYTYYDCVMDAWKEHMWEDLWEEEMEVERELVEEIKNEDVEDLEEKNKKREVLREEVNDIYKYFGLM
jgi:hypothetical protein